MKKKTAVLVVVISLLVIGGIIAAIIFLRNRSLGGFDKNLVYVESVRAINGLPIGNSSRFMGIVESQESKAVGRDSNKSIKEVYVKVGDVVKKGDKLFSYDTTSMEMSLEQLAIDRTGIVNSIDSLNTTLKDLTAQRDKAKKEDEKARVTNEINTTNTSIKEKEYELSKKDLEIKNMNESIEKAIVTCPMNGIIKTCGSADSTTSVDSDLDSDDFGDDDLDVGFDTQDESEDSNAFITIIAEGDYRIRGIADEMNVKLFTTGTNVVLRSRTDETVTWKGKITKVDMEPRQNNNSYDYYDNYGESASNYNFYVSPQNTDDMMLGQHLFIELDYGQGEAVSGIQLPSYYIFEEEESNYVWKRGEDGNIVKALVTLGEHNEEADTYEIKEGLTLDDYVAFPEETIKEGDPTTTNYEDIAQQEGEFDEGMDDEDEEFEFTGDMPDTFDSQIDDSTLDITEDGAADFDEESDVPDASGEDDVEFTHDPGESIDSPEDLEDDEEDVDDEE
ncbi:MAG: efflux RND transporter periplasmic adaptor subunit [Eubacterium sp.]|nr:efflux RND transporter periplasmic adaptor subunit [Eubacterium sp.]